MKSRPVFTRRPWVEELESRLVPSTLSYSGNWSGYAIAASKGAVSSVSGNWVVPTVSGSGTSYSSSWVGIDGWSSNSVEQIGTDSDLSGGSPVYDVWYEMYPAYPVYLSMTVSAGDTMSASVSYNTITSQFTLSIKDVNRSENFSVNKTLAGAQRSSAEWIVEAPSNGWSTLPLAPFGTENFSNAQLSVGSTIGPIDHFGAQVQQVDMIDGNRSDTTSAVSDSVSPSSFSVTYSGPSSSGSGHHQGGGGRSSGNGGGWGWWFAPNVSASQLTALEANALSSGSSLMSQSTGLTGNSSLLGTPHMTTAVPSNFSFAQNTAILVGGAARTNADVANTNTAPAPEAVMPLVPGDGQQPGQPDTPKADPNATPMPPADSDEAATLLGTPVALRQACDACFAEGQRTPAPRTEEQAAVLVAPSEAAATTFEAAIGFLFTLSLGGVRTWLAGAMRGAIGTCAHADVARRAARRQPAVKRFTAG